MLAKLLFPVSIILLIHVARIVTRKYATHGRDAFWVFAAACYLQISAVTVFLSLLYMLGPIEFVACQAFAVFVIHYLRTGKKSESPFKEVSPQFTTGEKGLVALVVLVLLVSFSLRIFTPLKVGDVLQYHAPRVLYWMHNASILPYDTANDRQICFSFGTDLIFLWPVLFTKAEFISRLVFWLGFPALAAGCYAVMRQLACSRGWSLVGTLAVVAMPIAFRYSITQEPLVWVAFFSLGACYFALRVCQTAARSRSCIFWLAGYAVLAGHAKANALCLLPAGAVVLLLVAWHRGAAPGSARGLLKPLGAFAAAALLGWLLSGLGLWMVQNKLVYGNWTSSDLRKEENIADISPYQLYVHTVRMAAVLAEVPLPFGHLQVQALGRGLIGLMGAAGPLPREGIEFRNPWRFVGLYKFRVERWPGGNNFGLAGLMILATFIAAVVLAVKKARQQGLRELRAGLMASEKLSYAIMAAALFILTGTVMRWIENSTHSFLAPGVICLLPLALSSLNRPPAPRVVTPVLCILVLIFTVGVTAVNSARMVTRAQISRFEWDRISHSQVFLRPLVDNHVPEDATLITLVTKYGFDYSFFGRNYGRKVIQIPDTLTSGRIEDLWIRHPGAYLYIIKHRYPIEGKLLLNDPRTKLVARGPDATIFKFVVPAEREE